MDNTEQREKTYLTFILETLEEAVHLAQSIVDRQYQEIRENKIYLQEHKRGMDHVEKVNVRETIENMTRIGENAEAKRARLQKLMSSPYFGRIDFKQTDASSGQRIYIGLHAFMSGTENKNLIYDWRAPVSGMYYDFEPGQASFSSPQGMVHGEILLKRQFRIREGKMEYMIESDLSIHDDILQRALSQASGEMMKNIVATIQREQNAIIRNETAHTLVIQGVAGSGKTSVALHRIAFLLYRHHESIQSEDILIISPNKVFAHYISNVLPELGEEHIRETTIETLANGLLDYKFDFETFSDQVSRLLASHDAQYLERMQFKATSAFTKQLDAFLLHLENTGFIAHDLRIKKCLVPAWFIQEKFQQHEYSPIFIRHNKIVADIVFNIQKYYNYEVSTGERTEIRNAVIRMFKSYNLRVLYKYFYEWLERPEMLRQMKGSRYEYADVFPLLYFHLRLGGFDSFGKVKHLVIDEMQDYSPIQYKVISLLFSCKKTILGDIHQAVNPFSASDLDTISGIMHGSECVTMTTSYRSTYEITQFANKIQALEHIIPVERHGEAPSVQHMDHTDAETAFIHAQAKHFSRAADKSVGILCKTQAQAEKLYADLTHSDDIQVTLLTPDSVSFSGGVIMTTVFLSKGLEFDHVIVPECTSRNYHNDMHRKMLYIACTRAMHKLTLTHTGELTRFIDSGEW